jgi:hypothetical protein
MQFAGGQLFGGLVRGINAVDANFATSPWASLVVRWDTEVGQAAPDEDDQDDRVSPWEARTHPARPAQERPLRRLCRVEHAHPSRHRSEPVQVMAVGMVRGMDAEGDLQPAEMLELPSWPPTDEPASGATHRSEMLRVLDEAVAYCGQPFAGPVHSAAAEFPGMLEHVSLPVHLELVRARLGVGWYRSRASFEADLDAVTRDCALFLPARHPLIPFAESLRTALYHLAEDPARADRLLTAALDSRAAQTPAATSGSAGDKTTGASAEVRGRASMVSWFAPRAAGPSSATWAAAMGVTLRAAPAPPGGDVESGNRRESGNNSRRSVKRSSSPSGGTRRVGRNGAGGKAEGRVGCSIGSRLGNKSTGAASSATPGGKLMVKLRIGGGRDTKRKTCSPADEEDLEWGLAALKRLEDADPCELFARPVDVAALPQYTELIKHPVDLSSIRSRLISGGYLREGPLSLERDLLLVAANCVIFNTPGDEYSCAALQLLETLLDLLPARLARWQPLRQHPGGGSETGVGAGGGETWMEALTAADKTGMFASPVDPREVPGYRKVDARAPTTPDR